MSKTPHMGLYNNSEVNNNKLSSNFNGIDSEFGQRGINIRWKGADPTGAADSSDALLAALADDSDAVYIPKGTYLINQNVTVPRYEKLVFDRNARFKIANGITFTVNGAISVHESDWIFDVSSGGKVTGAPLIGKVYPQWFGAKGDWNGTSGADDTAAIQAALDLAGPNKLFVYFPAGYYQVTSTLFLGSNVYITGYITGFSTKPVATASHCSIIFNSNDPNGYLFTGRTGVAGGQIIIKNIGIFTSLQYNDGPKKNIMLYTYDVKYHSLFEGVQIGLFDYVFYVGSFSMASRMQYCEIRNIGRTIFYNSVIVDAFFYNNYFHGTGTTYVNAAGDTVKVSCDFIHYPTSMAMCQFNNNWFEFFDYGFRTNVMNECTFVGNIFDFMYRVFDRVGIACTIVGNVFNHCSRNAMVTREWWQSTEALADQDWRTIVVEGYTGVTIVGNVAGEVDTFIDVVGGNGGIKDVYTAGNVIRTNSSPYTEIDKNRLIRVSVGTTSWLNAGHMTNVKLEELNDLVLTAPPQTGLFPGRRVIVNGQPLTLDASFKWRDKDGNPFGYLTRNLIPRFNNPAWNIPGPKWVVDSSGYKVTISGYTTKGWYDATLNLTTSPGKKYRFNTRTAYYANDGMHRNIIEIYLFTGTTKVLTHYYDQSKGSFEFVIPAGVDRIQIALRCNTTTDPALMFIFDTLHMCEYSNMNYGTIVRSPSGKKFMKYIDDSTGTEVIEPYV
ncbi:hypothetical protein PCURB6_22070 [Paenibacillus curdlanolyticus]|nr:glycoside hydrolase family 55 protein [Paenibacillus curdlanolyticus]GFN31947.1 hypothetical protein PCURB6_22070 [Paenibacillus curdlanolyticus]